jgi:hypothetical protein
MNWKEFDGNRGLWYMPRTKEADYEKPQSGYPVYQTGFEPNKS